MCPQVPLLIENLYGSTIHVHCVIIRLSSELNLIVIKGGDEDGLFSSQCQSLLTSLSQLIGGGGVTSSDLRQAYVNAATAKRIGIILFIGIFWISKFIGYVLSRTNIYTGRYIYNYDDAIKILDEKIFVTTRRPPFKRVVEDVDICTLDQGHVIPNMKPPIYRGVWL